MPKPLFAFFLITVLFAGCAQNNVTEDSSLKKHFDDAHISGSFGLFDNGQGKFTIYNLPRFRDSAYQPAQSFEILLSLIGIQTGLIKDDSAVIQGDRPITMNNGLLPAKNASGDTLFSSRTEDNECGHDLTLKLAFQRSCEPAFRAFTNRIGKDTLKRWIDSLGYGNKNVSGPIDSFWFNNQLKITSDEQLGLAKKMYFNQLPFFQRTQKIVCAMMQVESNANYQLSYKTGLGVKEDGRMIGWTVGWIEENKHPYFFVLNAESAGAESLTTRGQVAALKNILKQLGFFEGKK